MPNVLGINLPLPVSYSKSSETNLFKKGGFHFDFKEAKRICDIALKFLKLDPRVSGLIDIGSQSLDVMHNVYSLKTISRNSDQLKQLAFISYSIGWMAFSLINARLANLAQTTLTLIEDGRELCGEIREGEVKKALGTSVKFLSSTLFLGAQVYGGVELTVLSMAVRVLMTFYSALDDYLKTGEVRLEAIANLALACIYLKQMQPHVEELQRKYRVLRAPEFAFLLEHIRAAGARSPSGSISSIQELIQKKQGIVKDDKLGEIDLGTHVSNMGGNLVKDGLLCFRERMVDGKTITEVEFKLNTAQREAIQPFIDQLKTLPQDHLASFLHYAGVGGSIQVKEVPYSYLPKKGEDYTEVGKLNIGKAFQINFQGLGSIVIGADPECLSLYDRVVVRLNGQKETQDLKNLLSCVGLEKAMESSSPADIERIKIGKLFEAHHPGQATKLMNSKEFLNLSTHSLKAKIVQLAPDMQEKFNTVLGLMKPVETLPGRFHYTIPGLAKQAKELGAVALVSGVGGGAAAANNRVISMLKLGALSSQVRFDSGMLVSGASSVYDHYFGSAGEVFTRLIPKGACDRGVSIQSLPFAGDVLVVYKENELEKDPNRYHSDEFGSKKGAVYLDRPDLCSFVRSENDYFSPSNEVMVEDCIPTRSFAGFVVPTEMRRQELMQQMRKELLNPEVLKANSAFSKDAAGDLVINGIALQSFVRADTTLKTSLFVNATSSSR